MDFGNAPKRRGFRQPLGVAAAVSLLLLALLPAHADDKAQGPDISVEAGSLERALHVVTERLSVNILAASADIAGLTVTPRRLPADAEKALRLLIEGTDLQLVAVAEGTYALVKLPPPATDSKPVVRQTVHAFGATAPGLEEIVITGTRNGVRPALDAMAPVDTLAGDVLLAQPSEELIDVLATLLPGFTAPRRPLSDGQIFVRPAGLRGLSSDHMLVFINGKRRHRTAFLNNRGEQMPELSKIPQQAIGRIEVLRDGASAQYGSDAIAGVINVILDHEPGLSLFGQYGQYYAGDGDLYRIGARNGWTVGEGGFISATLEYFDQGMTSRTRQRPDAIAFQAAHPELTLPDPVQNWGQPQRDGVQAALNTGWDFGSDLHVYAFGTFGESDGLSDFNWRNPDTVSTYDPSATFPDFDLRDIYPLGYTPKFGQRDRDISVVAGLKGSAFGGALGWDISSGYGENRIDYHLSNSINASLGPDSPTAFDLGGLAQRELNSNIDLVYRVDSYLTPEPINIAVGAERRAETYVVTAGEPDSYRVGPAAIDGLPSGADGFPGYSDTQAGHFKQSSYATYLDVEIPMNTRWRVGLATRYEEYSHFGSALDGKFSTRFDLGQGFAVRGTFSTGFRAPTPGQLFSERTSKSLDLEVLETVTSGRFSPDGPVAQVISARDGVDIAPLKSEKAQNINVGLTYKNAAGLAMSLDFYQVRVKDRFGVSAAFDLTPAEQQALAALGVPGAYGIANVTFFQNDFDTVTRGFDLAASYETRVAEGTLALTAAYNLNSNKVTDGSLLGDPVARQVFEDGTPDQNAVASARYSVGRFEATLRGRYVGKWADQAQDSSGDIQIFGAEVFFDIAASYRISDHVHLRVGADNILNAYPDKATFQQNRGLIYSRNTPYDTDGGFYYFRTEITF